MKNSIIPPALVNGELVSALEIVNNCNSQLQKNRNMNKAHGWDQSSKRMIKTCGDSITFPLNFIFKSMLTEGVFPKTVK